MTKRICECGHAETDHEKRGECQKWVKNPKYNLQEQLELEAKGAYRGLVSMSGGIMYPGYERSELPCLCLKFKSRKPHSSGDSFGQINARGRMNGTTKSSVERGVVLPNTPTPDGALDVIIEYIRRLKNKNGK